MAEVMPGHDLERHAGLGQGGRLLAAAGEHERVAALEPHDGAAGAPALDEQRVDLVLRHRHLARRLADADPLGVGGRQVEQRLDRQPVVHDHVGPAQHLGAAHGEQARDRPARRPPGRRSRRGSLRSRRQRTRGAAHLRLAAALAAAVGAERGVGRAGRRRPRGAAPCAVGRREERAVERHVARRRRRGVGAGGQVAVAAELGEEGPLGVDAPPGRPVLDARPAGSQRRGRRRPGTRRPGRPGRPGEHRVDGEHARRSASARPSRSSAAAATTMASCSAALASRVCMLPRRLDEAEVGPVARQLGPAGAASRWPPRRPCGRSASVEPDQRVAGIAPLGHGGEDQAGHGRPTAGPWRSARRGRPARRARRPAPPWRTRPCRRARRSARRGAGRPACRRRRARPRARGRRRAAASATCSACQRASGLPAGRGPDSTATTRRSGVVVEGEEVAEGVGEALARGRAGGVLERDGGSCSSLAMMPVGERLDRVELARVEARRGGVRKRSSSAWRTCLGPVAQGDDQRGDLAGRRGAEVALELVVDDRAHAGDLAGAGGGAGRGEGAQVVHVEQGDAGQLDRPRGRRRGARRCRRSAAGRPARAVEHGRELVGLEERRGGAGGGEQHVDVGQRARRGRRGGPPGRRCARPGPRRCPRCGWR